MSCLTSKKPRTFRVFFLLQVSRQFIAAEFILCQGGGGYGGGGFNGGYGNGGYRSRNDIERATEVKRSREAGTAGTGDDFCCAEPSEFRRSFGCFGLTADTPDCSIGFLSESHDRSCAQCHKVTEADQFFQFQRRIVQRGSFAAHVATCCHCVAIHQLKQVPSIRVLVGWSAQDPNFENAEICTHAICPFI